MPTGSQAELALELHARWREQRQSQKDWDALLSLLELREVLRQSPAAAATLPPGFDPEREL